MVGLRFLKYAQQIPCWRAEADRHAHSALLQSQTCRRTHSYRVYVFTDHSYLGTKDGRHHLIMSEMVATAETKTGRKTVLFYLLRPINRAGEALRER